jgi:hypothetical protein
MSRAKKILLAALVLSSLEFLSRDLFTDGIFSRAAQPFPALLNTGSHGGAGAAKLDFPATPAGRFVLEVYGEPTPRSGGFLTAKETAGVSRPSVTLVAHFFRMIFAPKVSLYISNSVLNI